jgi:hypothetical protein
LISIRLSPDGPFFLRLAHSSNKVRLFAWSAGMTARNDPSALISAMAPRGRIDRSMLQEAMKTMAGRSLEAHGVHLNEVAIKLAAAGAVDPSSAQALHANGLWAFAPPTGDPWISALAVRSCSDLFVTCIEMSGRPNSKVDKFIENIFGRSPMRGPEPQPDPQNVYSVDVYRLPPDGDLDRLFADVAAEKWRFDRLFRCSVSFEAHGQTGYWRAGNTDLSVDGVDRWVEAFAALRAALEMSGGPSRISHDGKISDSRIYLSYREKAPDLAHYDAASDYGAHFARLDDYLPSANCVAGMTDIVSAQAGLDTRNIVDMLFRIHDACVQAGHVSQDEEYDFNDLDCFVHAHQEGDVLRIWLRDQNRRHRAEFATDKGLVKVAVFSAPVDSTSGSEKPLAQISVRPDIPNAAPEVKKGPGIAGDDIRAWNSFVSCVESVDCSLEEDYSNSPAP